MSDNDLALHYVCTLDESRKLVDAQKHFWVSNCACREHRGPCKRSRTDVCLQFAAKTAADGSHKKKASRATVDKIFEEAKEKHLVPRPFRNEDRTGIDGICFCCDDCCGYFRGLQGACDKGDLIEQTNTKLCESCGACTRVCFFGARAIDSEGQLAVDREKCYGCGLCVDVCPMDCVKMVDRNA